MLHSFLQPHRVILTTVVINIQYLTNLGQKVLPSLCSKELGQPSNSAWGMSYVIAATHIHRECHQNGHMLSYKYCPFKMPNWPWYTALFPIALNKTLVPSQLFTKSNTSKCRDQRLHVCLEWSDGIWIYIDNVNIRKKLTTWNIIEWTNLEYYCNIIKLIWQLWLKLGTLLTF